VGCTARDARVTAALCTFSADDVVSNVSEGGQDATVTLKDAWCNYLLNMLTLAANSNNGCSYLLNLLAAALAISCIASNCCCATTMLHDTIQQQ
jgi:hypothetical protein